MKANLMLLSLIVVMVGMTACNNGASGAASDRLRSATAPGALPTSSGTGYYQQGTGSIVNSNMTAEVKSFLSNGQLTPDSIGTVDPNTGVTFQGIVRFDNSNRLIASQSYITIKVMDDQALSGKAAPIMVTIFNNQSTGQVSVTQGSSYATAQIQFQDSYGTVVLAGYYDQNWFTGNLSYTNTVTGASGTLGQFRIPTCGFFVCLQ